MLQEKRGKIFIEMKKKRGKHKGQTKRNKERLGQVCRPINKNNMEAPSDVVHQPRAEPKVMCI